MAKLRRPVNKQTLLAWANEQIQSGAPRWPLYLRLAQMQSELDDVSEIQVFADVMESIEDALVDRNLKGSDLERKGYEDKAIALYEANVSDCFDGSHPYSRLRILYTNRGDYANAIRVCEAYINNGGKDMKLRESLPAEIIKLKAKLFKP